VRVVHVSSGYLPHETAGTQIYVRDLTRGLRARGHRVEVFTRLAGREHDELEVSHSSYDDVPVTRITNNFDDVHCFERLYTHPIIDARFEQFLQGNRPDIVHIHHLTGLSTSMIAVARRRGVPVVMTLHDYWTVCLRGQRIRPNDLGICEELDRERCLKCLQPLWPHLLPPFGARSLWERLRRRPPSLRKLHVWEVHMRHMLAQCQALIAPSRFHRDRFVEWGCEPSRMFVVPSVVDTAALSRVARGSHQRQHIGFIGSVIPSKGVHVLCDAFRRLNRADLVLDIHGEAPNFHGDTGYVDRLRELVPPHLTVRFHGRYEHRDLARILGGLDVLVVPSLWWESYCLTAREGAAAGLPVIASRLGALAEAVDEGVAVGFRAGDGEDLAGVLARHLGAQPRSNAGTATATLEAGVALVEQIYRSVLGEARIVNSTG
jgi:glycosyltransferase involved in cell wall biosynthesis